jgi:hypothetical protein
MEQELSNYADLEGKTISNVSMRAICEGMAYRLTIKLSDGSMVEIDSSTWDDNSSWIDIYFTENHTE